MFSPAPSEAIFWLNDCLPSPSLFSNFVFYCTRSLTLHPETTFLQKQMVLSIPIHSLFFSPFCEWIEWLRYESPHPLPSASLLSRILSFFFRFGWWRSIPIHSASIGAFINSPTPTFMLLLVVFWFQISGGHLRWSSSHRSWLVYSSAQCFFDFCPTSQIFVPQPVA